MNVCVCDIGGGTIDTQSLELLALSPLKAKESCVGTGDYTA
jgi:molecular chaperone DnaK (HSP70)